MTTALDLRTVSSARLRPRTKLLRRIALGLMVAASAGAMSLAFSGGAPAQPSEPPRLAAPPRLAQSMPSLPSVAPPQPTTSVVAPPAAAPPLPGGPAAAPPPALSAQPAPPPVIEPPELTGEAWRTADMAYKAHRDKNYAQASALAREALKLRPDVPRLWLLLMDSLEAQNRLAESVAAASEAVAAGIKDPTVIARLRAQSRILAQGPSLAANKALADHNPKAAIEAASRAIALVPDDLSYRMLLVYSLIADGQIEAAEKAASQAIEADPRSFLPRTMRGYLRERLGQIEAAEADFDEALKDEVLTGDTNRDVRIVIADAAIAAGHPERALRVLEGLDAKEPGVAARRQVANAQKDKPQIVPDNANQTLPVPYQKCIDTPYGPVCSLVPATTPPGAGVSDTPGYIEALEAFNAYRDGDNKLAETRIREALQASPGNLAWRRLLIDTLDRANKLEDLATAIREAIALGDTDPALVARKAVTDKRLAEPDAVQAIKDVAAGKTKAAVAAAKRAVDRAPDAMVYRVVQLQALLAADQTEEALAAANAAVQMDENDPLPRMVRGYLLQKTGKTLQARKDFDAVIGSNILTDLENVNYRLIAANAALANGQAEEALSLIEPIEDPKNREIDEVRKAAQAMLKSATAKRPALQAPQVFCQPTTYGVICSVFANQGGGGGGDASAPGYADGTEAYAALAKRDYPRAEAAARRAVAADPDNRGYRLLLMQVLTARGKYAEAEQIASYLLARSPRDATLLVQRGGLRLSAKDYTGAIRDYRAALASGNLPVSQYRAVRLSLADAALAAKQPEIALATLKPMANERSYDVQARLGYAYLALEDKESALAAFSEAAVYATTAQQRRTMLSARIGVLVQLGRKDEAKQIFLEAYNRGELRGMKAVDLAVLAGQVGEDQIAYDYFTEADAKWQLRGTTLIDAAYNARRTYHNNEAIGYFKRAIDEHREGKLPMDPQYLFGLRREVAELSRTWGAYLSASYGSSAGIAPSSPLAPLPISANRALGIGGEIYWRPPGIGYRDGAIFELFVRGYGTAYSEGGGAGWDTVQGSVGARWKPIKDQNLIFETAYLFPVGQAARQDWLLRAAYSKGEGTDLRVDVPHWRTWQIYADYNYFAMSGQTVSSFEARYGESFRLDAISNRLVLWPFLAIGGSYDNSVDTPFALGAGPGATLRYWFREDEYTAPMSYLDLTLQYRFKLAGDDRAEGIFAGAFLSY
jgi:tetratricopeptide (TPR) repeat protein